MTLKVKGKVTVFNALCFLYHTRYNLNNQRKSEGAYSFNSYVLHVAALRLHFLS